MYKIINSYLSKAIPERPPVLREMEEDAKERNHIFTLFVGGMVKSGSYHQRIDHYRVLRTLEEMYGLPYAGNSATATAISNVWK